MVVGTTDPGCAGIAINPARAERWGDGIVLGAAVVAIPCLTAYILHLSMQTETVEPFADNWAYLRAELSWLDRVLSLAIARQRKDTKEVDRLTKSRADRVTSHWWKGIISLEGEIFSDSPAAPRKSAPAKLSYQQQVEAKIRASQQRGICLGLPSLCDRLRLSLFEKNLVLMALAPEISRRYGRIYNYLQDTEQAGAPGLPTVDLILRLLCRNDGEWRSARRSLTEHSYLIQQGLLEVKQSQLEPLLNRWVKLSDSLVSYLLAEQPNASALEELLQPRPSTAATLLLCCPAPPIPWDNLILPDPLVATLQHLCHRVEFAQAVDEALGLQVRVEGLQTAASGAVVWCVGARGTGKTTAALAIAHHLQSPLFWVDLALLPLEEQDQVLAEIVNQAPTVLLLKSAQVWFGRTPGLAVTQLQRLLHDRQHSPSLTLLSVEPGQTLPPHWRRQGIQILEFPVPDQWRRLQLWKQAVPAQIPVEAAIDWAWLAQAWPLTGGEIRTIVREAALYAAAEAPDAKLGMAHLLQAYRLVKGKLPGKRALTIPPRQVRSQ